MSGITSKLDDPILISKSWSLLRVSCFGLKRQAAGNDKQRRGNMRLFFCSVAIFVDSLRTAALRQCLIFGRGASSERHGWRSLKAQFQSAHIAALLCTLHIFSSIPRTLPHMLLCTPTHCTLCFIFLPLHIAWLWYSDILFLRYELEKRMRSVYILPRCFENCKLWFVLFDTTHIADIASEKKNFIRLSQKYPDPNKQKTKDSCSLFSCWRMLTLFWKFHLSTKLEKQVAPIATFSESKFNQSLHNPTEIK